MTRVSVGLMRQSLMANSRPDQGSASCVNLYTYSDALTTWVPLTNKSF
jgi:hypothetical protein